MDTPLRPDLGKILPTPRMHHLAARQPPFRDALSLPRGNEPDYVLDVQRERAHDAGDPGFDLGQANAVAARIAGWFRAQPARDELPRAELHHVAADRARTLLAPA